MAFENDLSRRAKPETEAARQVLDEMAAAIDPKGLTEQLRGFVQALAEEFQIRLTAGETHGLHLDAFNRNWARVVGIYAMMERVRLGGGIGGPPSAPIAWEDYVKQVNAAVEEGEGA